MTPFRISPEFVARHNRPLEAELEQEFRQFSALLARRGLNAEDFVRQAQDFAVALPSWGVGTGGTRFARFPGPGEPRDVFEKLDDCATVHELVRATPRVS